MTQCAGKVRYDSPAQAKRVLREIQRKNHHHPPKRFYRCFECRGWHLTSKDKWADG